MKKMVPVGISARHVHLSQNDLETLFGKGYELTWFKDLSQPGQFAAEEKVNMVSEAGKELKNIRILGPVRKSTQVEISRSDAIRMRIDAPVRFSGDIAGSGKATLIGPNGEVKLLEGVIVADRHVHMSTEDAKEYGVKDMDKVSLLATTNKGGIFHNVTCRVSDSYALDCHIDTDDASAFGLNNGDMIELIK